MPELNVEEITDAIGAHSLAWVFVGDHVVVMGSEFDVVLSGEPYIARMLLLNLKSGAYITRIWNRTTSSGVAADTREFESLCKDLFGRGRPCVGLTDDVDMGQEYLLLHSPIPRKVSKSCLNMVKDDTEGNSCSECLQLRASNVRQPKVSRPAEHEDLDNDVDLLDSNKSDEDTMVEVIEDGNLQDQNEKAVSSSISSSISSVEKCQYCRYKGSKLGKHMEEDHTCRTCCKFFKSTCFLLTHTKQHLLSEGMDEEEARKELNALFPYTKQALLNKGPVFHKCDICDKKFVSSKLMNSHKKQAHRDADAPAVCPKCQIEFENLSVMRKHLLKEHPMEKLPCEHCGLPVTRDSLQNHIAVFHKEAELGCNHCELKFKTRANLKAHEIKHHSTDEKYNCKHCGIRCESIHSLKVHMRSHEKPQFKCGYCEKMFKTKGNVSVHEREHTGERPFVCDVCGKGFKSSNALYTHRTHVHKIIKPGTNPNLGPRERKRMKE